VNAAEAHPQSAEILAALPLRQRPGLYIGAVPDHNGNLVIYKRHEDPDEGPAETIAGLAVRDGDGWYLGCIECGGEVREAGAGMCVQCREDLALRDQEYVADEPAEPLPAPAREDY